MGWSWTVGVSVALAVITLGGCTSPPSHVLLPDAVGMLSDGPGVVDAVRQDAQCGGLVCPLGCNVEAGRCNRLAPSNFDVQEIFDNQGLADVCDSGCICQLRQCKTTMVIDTDTGGITYWADDGEGSPSAYTIRPAGNAGAVVDGIYWNVVTQAAKGYPNLELSVFAMRSFRVPAPLKLEVQGKLPVALYTTGDVKIEGQIVSLPEMYEPGAGGFSGGSKLSTGNDGSPCPDGSAAGQGKAGGTDADRCSGGGGGGRKRIGGEGGSAGSGSSLVSGGAGGQPVGNAELTPLFGGCGGGAAGASWPYGGGGGGAIQISANGTISVSGTINMPGAGGAGGPTRIGPGVGGGGGGAGGAILLEAAQIAVADQGVVAANGGGGGGGGGSNGESGLAATARAKGGTPLGGGAGGPGGARGAGGSPQDEAGGNGEDHITAAGGGGGSAGRIRFNASSISVDPGAVISPAPSESTSVGTW